MEENNELLVTISDLYCGQPRFLYYHAVPFTALPGNGRGDWLLNRSCLLNDDKLFGGEGAIAFPAGMGTRNIGDFANLYGASR